MGENLANFQIANRHSTIENTSGSMPYHDADISWQTLRRIVRDWAGESAELAEVKPLDGGSISTTLAITLTDGQKCALKVSPHRVNRDFEREVYQLDLLRGFGIPTPRVYTQRIGSLEDPHSYILMEYVDGVDLAEAKRRCDAGEFDHLQHQLAEMVLLMHSQTGQSYCRVTGPQPEQFTSWPAFYHKVYDPIWKDVEKDQQLTKHTRKLVSKVHDRLERLIGHEDCPRLVHWDIWATNVLACPNGTGHWKIAAVLDPNCKFAHAEAEIAYIDLFHTSTASFMKTYQASRKLDDGYQRVRKHVYQLYPLVNHFHLFGPQYLAPLTQAAERAAALV
jgi:fructosamine-3-kinase